MSDGTTYYYGLNRTHSSDGDIFVYNAHGDTVQLVNNNAVVVSYTYDAFGNLTNTIGESDNAFLYCSEYFDAETQTYYLRARYYNPANGRFTQQDAWEYIDTADPLTLNLYTYCCNNPVMYVDPSGRVGLFTTIREFFRVRSYQDTKTATTSFSASNRAKKMANQYAIDNGMYNVVTGYTEHGFSVTYKEPITWDNSADALRHMIWNSIMAREIGTKEAITISNIHEQEALKTEGWITNESSSVIVTKMNQPTLMDLWNNYTGAVLANVKKELDYNELFEYAINNNMLFTDATSVYEKLGITAYINEADWTVNVTWYVSARTITLSKENMPDKTLVIGMF